MNRIFLFAAATVLACGLSVSTSFADEVVSDDCGSCCKRGGLLDGLFAKRSCCDTGCKTPRCKTPRCKKSSCDPCGSNCCRRGLGLRLNLGGLFRCDTCCEKPAPCCKKSSCDSCCEEGYLEKFLSRMRRNRCCDDGCHSHVKGLFAGFRNRGNCCDDGKVIVEEKK